MNVRFRNDCDLTRADVRKKLNQNEREFAGRHNNNNNNNNIFLIYYDAYNAYYY